MSERRIAVGAEANDEVAHARVLARRLQEDEKEWPENSDALNEWKLVLYHMALECCEASASQVREAPVIRNDSTLSFYDAVVAASRNADRAAKALNLLVACIERRAGM